VAPSGTPTGLPPSQDMLPPSQDMMLPAHLIGLSSADLYPLHRWRPARVVPSWLVPAVIAAVLAVLIGVIAALAT
jgi:hypothetical protein